MTLSYFLLTITLPAFLLALFLTPFMMLLARKAKIVANPGIRKIHKKPIPLMGGFGIYLTVIILAPILDYIFFGFLNANRELAGLLLGSTIMLCLGIIDDKLNLSAKEKLIFQFLAALIASLMGWKIQSISIPFVNSVINLEYMSVPFSIFWYVGVMNAFNMIDGLDGAASGIALIAFSTCAYIFFFYKQNDLMLISLLFVGALLGFLVYNFNPAKIFLGDTGSLMLGFTLGLLATKAPSLTTPIGGHYINSCSIFVTVSILFYPLLDMAFALIRRYAKGSGLFRPDKSHIHHKLLIYFSLNPKLCALFIYFLGLCGAICSIMLFNRNTQGLIGTALLYSMVLLYIFNKFQYRESISKTSKIQKNKTKTLIYLRKMMNQKIEFAKSMPEIERILEWVMEETEVAGIEIVSRNVTLLQLGEIPSDKSDHSFVLSAIKGKLRLIYKSQEYYHAELERDLCLQDIAQDINVALQDILKSEKPQQ